MTDSEESVQQEFDNFVEKYNFTFYEVNDENRELVSKMDPRLVWTSHTTCDQSYVAPGFLEFSPENCCWHEQEWYVSETPWESDSSTEWVQTSYMFDCPDCNPDGEETEGDEDCTICDGNGFYTYYTD